MDHLFVLVTYDVETTTADGKRRLREVAKICMNYGQRVQYSVFECLVDPLQYKQLKTKLMKIIDEERDSLRFYNIGSKWKRKVEHVGAKPSYDPEGLLLIE